VELCQCSGALQHVDVDEADAVHEFEPFQCSGAPQRVDIDEVGGVVEGERRQCSGGLTQRVEADDAGVLAEE
jgi:hypothetical protein